MKERRVMFPSVTRTHETTTPIGEAFFPNLVEPDTKFGKVPVYRVKLRVGVDDAKGFFAECQTVFSAAHPGIVASVWPVRRDKAGRPFILAESTRPPNIQVPGDAFGYEPRHGDVLRLHGALVPFSRNGRRGVNFRISEVEPAPMVKGSRS